MTTRLNININDETKAALEDLATRKETSVTEIVRRAVSVYKFIADEVDADKTVQVVGPEGDTRTFPKAV